MSNKTVSFVPTLEQWERIDQIADERMCSTSAVVRWLIAKALETMDKEDR